MYCSIPGPLQSVQRAEIWEVLIALQGQTATHIGVDNLNVVNHVSSLIANRWSGRLFPLVNDGDLLCLAQGMVRSRGRGNSLVAMVKGHADEGLVTMGRVREVDRIGNNEADAAADMGRRRVHDSITDARRLLNAACARWYPIVKELQHFFIAIAGTTTTTTTTKTTKTTKTTNNQQPTTNNQQPTTNNTQQQHTTTHNNTQQHTTTTPQQQHHSNNTATTQQ